MYPNQSAARNPQPTEKLATDGRAATIGKAELSPQIPFFQGPMRTPLRAQTSRREPISKGSGKREKQAMLARSQQSIVNVAPLKRAGFIR
jgi:hypothetical protein